MQQNQPINYQFDMIIIKPNTCEPNKSYNFEENYYKLLNHTPTDKPLNINDDVKKNLLSYLLKKDYFETKTFNFNSLLYEIEIRNRLGLFSSFYNNNKSFIYYFSIKPFFLITFYFINC